jgi:hypothetical protein
MCTARNRMAYAVPSIALALLLQGCSATPRFDKHFGEAVRANLAAQVIDPDAAANANPAAGMDGVAARASHERYQRSFKENAGTEQPLIGGSGSK